MALLVGLVLVFWFGLLVPGVLFFVLRRRRSCAVVACSSSVFLRLLVVLCFFCCFVCWFLAVPLLLVRVGLVCVCVFVVGLGFGCFGFWFGCAVGFAGFLCRHRDLLTIALPPIEWPGYACSNVRQLYSRAVRVERKKGLRFKHHGSNCFVAVLGGVVCCSLRWRLGAPGQRKKVLRLSCSTLRGGSAIGFLSYCGASEGPFSLLQIWCSRALGKSNNFRLCIFSTYGLSSTADLQFPWRVPLD